MEYIRQLFSKLKMHVIYIGIICILLCGLCFAINKCSNVSHEYKHNIEALNDTIKYYQDKHGNLVATKLAFESDVNTLKKLNKSLYDQIDSLKLNKNSVAQIIYVDNQISNPEKDTTYIITHDTISRGFSKDFAFNDNYRDLEGNVNYFNDSLGIHINKDVVKFDYTVALDKKGRVYVKSTNPYISYNEISGFTIPKERTKRWSLGPSINSGYDPINKKFSFSLGVSLNYGILKW